MATPVRACATGWIDSLVINAINTNAFDADNTGDKDATSAIQAALNAVPSAGGIVFIPAGTYLISTALVPKANTLMIGAGAGSILKKNAAIAVLNVTNNLCSFRDFVVEGNKANFTGSGNWSISGADCSITNCISQNAGNQGMNLSNALRFRVSGCYITGCNGYGMIIQKNSADGVVEGCVIDSTGATTATTDAIVLDNQGAGNQVKNIAIVGNRLTPGGANGFGVETLLTSGTSPTGMNISNNIIVLGNNCGGGISLNSTFNSIVSNNIIDTDSFQASVGGIEVVLCSTVSITGNTLNGGTGMLRSVVIDKSSKCSVIGNMINGFNTGANQMGIFVTSTGTSKSADYNIINGNVVIFQSGGAGKGIWIQENGTSGCTCNYNLVSGNTIIGDGTAGSTGIQTEADNNLAFRNTVIDNILQNIETGIVGALYNGSTTGGTWRGNIFDTVVSGFGVTQQSVTAAGSTIVFTTSETCTFSPTSALTLTSTPTIANGYPYQRLSLINYGASAVSLQDQGSLGGSNLRLEAAAVSIGPRQSLSLMYEPNIGDWIQMNKVTAVI